MIMLITNLYFSQMHDTGKESAIRSFKLPIKEKFRKSHDILGYTELILYSN